MTRQAAREVIKGWVENGPSVTTHEPDFLVVNGLQVLRFEARSTSASAPFVFLNYVFAGKKGLSFIGFATDAAHLSQVKEIAEAAVASVSMLHDGVPMGWTQPH